MTSTLTVEQIFRGEARLYVMSKQGQENRRSIRIRLEFAITIERANYMTELFLGYFV